MHFFVVILLIGRWFRFPSFFHTNPHFKLVFGKAKTLAGSIFPPIFFPHILLFFLSADQFMLIIYHFLLSSLSCCSVCSAGFSSKCSPSTHISPTHIPSHLSSSAALSLLFSQAFI